MRQIVDRLQESAFKVSEQGQRLIRAEIALAQAEVKAKAQQAAPGVARPRGRDGLELIGPAGFVLE